MSLEFIDLRRTNAESENEARTSALAISGKFEGLRVLGNLPHGYQFEPSNVAAARKLIDWLEKWVSNQETERAEIVGSIARTLFVNAFANACDDPETPAEWIDGSQAPGAGADWFGSVTDDTPPEATAKAREIVDDFESRNERSIESAGAKWSALDFYYGGGRSHDLEQFGHYIAMTYLDHGVGLWDDFKGDAPQGFDCGHSEFYL